MKFITDFFRKYYGADSQDIDAVNPETPMESSQKYFWIIDPGHGAKTKGKRSPVDENGNQLLEYEYNQEIAHHLSDMLNREGIENIITIPDPTNFGNALYYRVNKANNLKTELPKIFVSIHGNAGPSDEFSTAFRGIETFFFSERGRELATVFQSHLVDTLQLRDRGVKYGRFFVLRNTTCPAILTETGFYNNPDEFKKMMNPNFRKRVAEAHLEAIKEIESSI